MSQKICRTILGCFLLGSSMGLQLLANCTPPPSGLVDWWRGNGTTGQLNQVQGSFRSGARTGPGRIGEGFVLGGNNDALQLPPSFQLSSQEFTVEAWIRRADTVHAGLPVLAGEIFAGSAR